MPQLIICSLNAWAGRCMHQLVRFVEAYRNDVDIFCFQEVYDTDTTYLETLHPREFCYGPMAERLRELLPKHDGNFLRHDDPNRMSVMTFVRETITRKFCGMTVFDPARPVHSGSAVISSRKVLAAHLYFGDTKLSVVNYHGLWVNGPKSDSPERLVQSERLNTFISELCAEDHVLVGDLNLLPDTKSLALLAEGRQDLVKMYGITSTRTPLYRHFANPNESNFADYAFASSAIAVSNFRVLPDIASDHAPLLITLKI